MNIRSIPALTVILVFLTILLAGCWKGSRPVDPPVRNNPYVGAAICAKCHRDIYTDYLTTGHSQQYQPVTAGQAPEYYWDEAMPFPVENPPGDRTWDDISLVLGGHFGFGVFFDKEGYLISGPQTYWNITAGRWGNYDPAQTAPYDCARCHMSGYDPDGSQDEFPSLQGSWEQGGVTCEGCHGPGRAHARSRDAADILVDTSDGFCLGCHGATEGHPLPGFGDTDLGNSHGGSCSWCHNPHVSFKYEFERSIWRQCWDCHTSDEGIERLMKQDHDGVCGR